MNGVDVNELLDDEVDRVVRHVAEAHQIPVALLRGDAAPGVTLTFTAEELEDLTLALGVSLGEGQEGSKAARALLGQVPPPEEKPIGYDGLGWCLYWLARELR